MRLCHTDLDSSPDRPGHVRLSGIVAYDRTGRSETYWFEAPAEAADSVSRSGNPWLALLVPLAVWLNEPLQIDLAVDERLRDNVLQLSRLWHGWFPRLEPVEIVAATSKRTDEPPPGTAVLFSGGVDSYFSVLRREPALSDPLPPPPIDDLLHVWGFDYPTSACAAYARVRSTLEPAAHELGKSLVVVRTNLRETRWQETRWAEMSHGCALAASALVLEERYGRVLVPATHTLAYRGPWGSAPGTDPLLSTSRTEILHDGADFSRVEKTRLVARSDAALRSLRVCWKGTGGNCSECGKCYRTMATLLLLGALDRCPTFDRTRFDLERLAHVLAVDANTAGFLREVRAFAVELGREDVARAIDRSLRHSRHLRPVWWLCDSLHRLPYAWRLSEPLERRLRSRSIV